MQPFSCQHREKRISKWNYEISAVQKLLFLDLHYRDGPLKLLCLFLKYIFWIWDGGLANFFWDHAIQISIRPNYEKLKSCVEIFTPYNQTLCMSIDFYFDTDQALINSVQV
jgi:hypothetical protein